MDFATIKTEVASWLLDLPSGASSRIGDWVNEAIRQAAERHNFLGMQDGGTYSTTNEDRTLTEKPANWKELRGDPFLIHQDGTTTPLTFTPSISDLLTRYGAQLPAEGNTTPADIGTPRYLIEGSTHLFVYPIPDDESDWDNGLYRIEVRHWALPATLVQDTDENFLTVDCPYYCIFKAASLGFRWNKDRDSATEFEVEAEKQFKSFRRRDRMGRVPDRLTIPIYKGANGRIPRTGRRL